MIHLLIKNRCIKEYFAGHFEGSDVCKLKDIRDDIILLTYKESRGKFEEIEKIVSAISDKEYLLVSTKTGAIVGKLNEPDMFVAVNDKGNLTMDKNRYDDPMEVMT